MTFWKTIKDQWSTQPPVLKADLSEKTIIVLGANVGIGFEAAKHFAAMNPARLILACRSQSKGQVAVEKLKAATGCATAELWIIDLANFESVKQFASKFEQDVGRLDILVENAAVANFKFEPTTDGWETSLQVNHLSTSLLALLLLPSMVNTAVRYGTLPRLVVVSSGPHHWPTIDKSLRENPEIIKTMGDAEYCTSPGGMRRRYPITKLLNIFFVRALNARLPSSTPLIVNTVSPGYCYSDLRRNFTGMLAIVDFLMELFLAFPAEVGARRLVYAALGQADQPDKLRGEYIAGAYIAGSRVTELGDFILSPEGSKTEDLVWEDTLDILNKVDSRVKGIAAEYLSPVA
ncbi:hypothetical protein B0H11DRAFT_1927217 [Mycena galericulata]|nr:hypothetical protein B0H11DRAFT_1927217 [Mycena galericulata]